MGDAEYHEMRLATLVTAVVESLEAIGKEGQQPISADDEICYFADPAMDRALSSMTAVRTERAEVAAPGGLIMHVTVLRVKDAMCILRSSSVFGLELDLIQIDR